MIFGKAIGATYLSTSRRGLRKQNSTGTHRFSSPKSEMGEFYRDKNIFITGATGFLGKALLEKLLSSCPNVRCIYMLIRGKRNLTATDRLVKLRKEPIFMKYLRVDARTMSKIVVIEGHFGDNGLEISANDRRTLIENVNVVFHCAATTRFNEPLDVAMKNIFIGTKTMVKLAKEMNHLSSFVYVSTAYSNTQVSTVEERVYDMKIDGDSVMALYESNSKETVEEIVRRNYFEGRPNTYTFAKATAENYIRKHCHRLPVTIARPSIVGGALIEPEPGFCDSANAVSYGFIYQGLGICRYYPIKETAIVDIVPLDVVINSLLIVAREVALQTIPVTSVYNITANDHWLLTVNNINECKLKAFMRAPPVSAPRPFSYRTREMSKFEQFIVKYFSELSFAIIVDMISKILNKKSRMLALTLAIQSTREDQKYFSQHTWSFPRKNMDTAIGRLSNEDQKLFPAFPDVKDSYEYFYKYWMSLRELKLGEKIDNIEEAQRHHRRLLIRSRVISIATAAFLIYIGSTLLYD